jgi:hypothetical protein
MTIETIAEIRGNDYQLEAVYHDHNDAFAWNAYRKSWSGWTKIPCWTDAEERAFPKLVAQAAHDFVTSLNAQLGREAA